VPAAILAGGAGGDRPDAAAARSRGGRAARPAAWPGSHRPRRRRGAAARRDRRPGRCSGHDHLLPRLRAEPGRLALSAPRSGPGGQASCSGTSVGHGRSGQSSSENANISQLGADLYAVLMATAPGATPVVLVGHSMGGMTIMARARQHPELFGPQGPRRRPDFDGRPGRRPHLPGSRRRCGRSSGRPRRCCLRGASKGRPACARRARPAGRRRPGVSGHEVQGVRRSGGEPGRRGLPGAIIRGTPVGVVSDFYAAPARPRRAGRAGRARTGAGDRGHRRVRPARAVGSERRAGRGNPRRGAGPGARSGPRRPPGAGPMPSTRRSPGCWRAARRTPPPPGRSA